MSDGHKAKVTRRVPPWHTWGNVIAPSHRFTVGTGPWISSYQQIGRVAYGRPETFRFLLWASPFGFPNRGQNNALNFEVVFQIMTGIGRAAIQLPTQVNVSYLNAETDVGEFARFRWFRPSSGGPPVEPKWTAAVRGSQLDDEDATSAFVTESIVGQDIQIGCYIRGQVNSGIGPDVPVTVGAQVGVLLAPWSHTRPDWSAAVGNFAAGELNGS